MSRYQGVLSDAAKSLSDRRRALAQIDAELGQAITRLNEAVPVSLIAAYAQELNSSVTVANRPVATKTINALLRKHGQALDSVLSTIEIKANDRPIFPAKAGLVDTMQYLGNFAALAGVIWVAEGIFPLALFIYTLLFLIRQREQKNVSAQTTSPTVIARQSVVKVHPTASQSSSQKHLNGGKHVE